MNEKGNKKRYRWIVSNLLKAALLILALVLAAQLILKAVTRHNSEIAVPDFSGMSMEDAQKAARSSKIRIEVTDSIFNRHIARGIIFSQNPVAGSKVKKGRRIMLTTNATKAQTVSMPNLVGLSLRQAAQDIASAGLSVGRLTYKEDIATNNVLAQYSGGKAISQGTEIETESTIDLLLGRDPEESHTYVPNLLGYTLRIAKESIIDNSLNIGTISFDETVSSYQDSIDAIVYKQNPYSSSQSPILMGTSVNLYLTRSQAKLSQARREAEEVARASEEELQEEEEVSLEGLL
ncbi:MAG: PASTA domain-containing protein [Bacteroidales bacterium]|nr:PASTA domain-containing protein [Candidatus Cacconaster caballi]